MLTVAAQHSYPLNSLRPAHPVLAAAAALQHAHTQCVVETVVLDAAESTMRAYKCGNMANAEDFERGSTHYEVTLCTASACSHVFASLLGLHLHRILRNLLL
jgi:hypothetical protein